jgi:hypothetical protein
MKYAVEMPLGAMIYVYIRGFIKICLGIKRVNKGNSQTQGHRPNGYRTTLLSFYFQNKEYVYLA